ncbi:hypothetical protein BH18GEM1_BH18GEM1_19890 [soil metagenome]
MAQCGQLTLGAPRAVGFLLALGLFLLVGCSGGESEEERTQPAAGSAAQPPPAPAWLGRQAEYARSLGETLRYEDASFASVRVIGPQGDRFVNLDEQGVLALTFLARDTARAWYEELAITAISSSGRSAPPTDSLLGRPFVLLFDARGRVETLEAPAVPTDSLEIVEPGLVFAGFFLPLPEEPLEPGLAWSDSVVRTLPRSPSGTIRLESIGRYHVVGDTLILDESVLVVEYERSLTYGAEGGVAVRAEEAVLSLKGSEEGRFLFAPVSGRMLGREYSGTLRGVIGPAAGGRGGTVREFYEYRGTTSLEGGKP